MAGLLSHREHVALREFQTGIRLTPPAQNVLGTPGASLGQTVGISLLARIAGTLLVISTLVLGQPVRPAFVTGGEETHRFRLRVEPP